MSTARILDAIPTQQIFHLDLSGQGLDDSYNLKEKLATLQGRGAKFGVEVDLSSNYLNVEAAKSIAKWLESGDAPRRTIIHLNANDMNDDAAKLLANASSSSKAPKHLTINLGSNNITDLGAEHWARVFSANNSQLELSLASNKITEKGALLLETAQRVARRSLVLDLDGNPLDVVTRDNQRQGATQSIEDFRYSHGR